MIALTSKTYILKESEDSYKLSCKGVNKRRVIDPMEIFTSVLETKRARSGNNLGFRARKNTMYTYSQERSGFSYFYAKREVMADVKLGKMWQALRDE